MKSVLPRAAAMLFVLAAPLAFANPAFAQEALRGVALVIGNGDYEHLAPLPNPPGDADVIERLLADLGFDSVRRTDRDAQDLARDLERFVEDAEDADVAVLYYAGHGIEAGGENWLVPVDANISSLESAATSLVPVSGIIQRLRETVSVTIVLLDACRDNPFPPGSTLKLAANANPVPVSAGGLSEPGRGASPTLTILNRSATSTENLGIIIGFAAAPGQVALDGEEGENSPYAAALTRHISAMTGEEFGTVMRMVAEEVYLKTGGRQRPWVNESLRRLLYFGDVPEPVEGDEGDILAERRNLLLTIAALPDFHRKQVESAATQEGVPMDALFGVVRALGREMPRDPAKLDELLRSEAERISTILAEREVINSPDPEIVRLSSLADTAEKEGLLRKAGELRERAKSRFLELELTLEDQEQALRQRFIEGAAVFARSAETRTLAFDHLGAARDYAEAAARVAGRDYGLTWRYRHAEMLSLTNHGNYKGDNGSLEKAVATGHEVLAMTEGPQNRASWAVTQNSLGNALMVLGQRQSGSEHLEQAVGAYRAALEEWTRDKAPVDWARAQTSLGATLQVLGQRESGTERLQQAVVAYSTALQEVTRQTAPLDWARTQIGLGGSLQIMGERESGTERLEQAVAAYRAALQEWTRESVPFGWAITQSNLGGVLQIMGYRESGTERLEEAVAAYRAALEELGRDYVPIDWARAQAGLAGALRLIGQRESGTERLKEAVAAYRASLEEWTRERSPLDWGTTQTGLGGALQIIGQRESGTARLEEAVLAYRAASEELTRQRVPLDWARTQVSLATALHSIGEREGGTERLEQAVVAYRAAMEEWTRERVPLDWGRTQGSLGAALQIIGQREDSTERLEEAVAAYRASLEEVTRQRVPLDWARTQTSLGTALQTLGGKEAGNERLEQAVAAYRAALQEWTRERVPLDWALTQSRLAGALQVIGQRSNDTAMLHEAVAAYHLALEEQTRERNPIEWARAQYSLGTALQAIGTAEPDGDGLERAVVAYSAALEEMSHDQLPLDWIGAQNSLGAVLAALAGRETGPERLQQAVAAHRAALEVIRRERQPLDWAYTQSALGAALTELGRRTGDRADVDAGREALGLSWEAYRAAGYTQYDDWFRSMIASADEALAAMR